MVLWQDLTNAISKNKESGFCVSCLITKKEGDIERFPILLVKNEIIISKKPIEEEADEESESEPEPEPTPPTEKTHISPTHITLTAAISSPTRAVHRQQFKDPFTLKKEVDPIVIGIEQNDPLYDGAPYRTKHQIECEEAQRLEGMLNDLYKSQGGRSRGWTKTGLESMIKPRCASGGDIKELDRAKKAFLWQLVVDDKPCSAFLDYVCVAKKIRVAVWFMEKKQVILYPAADNLDDGNEFPLYNVTSQGLPQVGIRTCAELMTYCDSNSYILMPPNSVVHSLTTLNLAELESVGKKLGMTAVEGSKAERVAKVAIYKLRQRLTQ